MPSQQDILSYLTSLGGNQEFAQSGTNLFNQFTQPIRPDTGALQGLLQNQLAGDPNKGRYRQAFNKQLGRSSSRAIKDINEQLSGSGFRGAGANLINDVFETEAMATENFESNLLDKDIMIKQNAVAQLLGIEGMKLGASQADRAAQMSMFGQLTGNQFQNRGLDLQERQLALQEDAGSDFWDVLGGVLGTGAGFFTGGLGSNLASSLFRK